MDAPPPGDDDYLERARPAPNGAPPVAAASPSHRVWPSAASYLARMGPVGRRWSTCIPTLDGHARGGVPRGKRVVLVGAPGAAKTMLATMWAFVWEMAGAAVVYLAADEGPENIAMRLGQLAGYHREDLEADDDFARRAAADRLSGRRILLLDGEDATLEDAIAALQPGGDDRQRVLVVDSLQTVRSNDARGIDGIRERISAITAIMRGPARAGAIVVGISEMARQGYRSNDRTQETSALASAKESGAIEYAAELLLGLRSVRGEVGQIEVEVAKNRLGRTPGIDERIRLRVDFAGASLSEIAASDRPAGPPPGYDRLAKVKQRLKEAVMRQELTSKTQVVLAATGNKQDNLRILGEMLSAGEVVMVNGLFRVAPGKSDE
jgi:hypothetical protein